MPLKTQTTATVKNKVTQDTRVWKETPSYDRKSNTGQYCLMLSKSRLTCEYENRESRLYLYNRKRSFTIKITPHQFVEILMLLLIHFVVYHIKNKLTLSW